MKSRYLLLVQSGIILFSIWYAYDIPAALNRTLRTKNTENAATHITALYSAYACPNIVVPLFFSYLSRFSKLKLALSLVFIVLIGQIIFTYGIQQESLMIMIIGRIVFGIGGESFSIIQNRILFDHFKGKELAFAMGLFNSCGRLGTVFNFFITPIVATYLGSLPSSILSLIFLLCGLLISVKICFNSDFKLEKNKNTNEEYIVDVSANNAKSDQILSVLIENCREFENSKPENTVLDQNPFTAWEKQKNDPSYLSYSEQAKRERDRQMRELNSDRGFDPSFKILVAISFLFGMVWAPFYNIAPMMFQAKYKVNIIESSHMLGLVEFISITLVLIIGPVADKFGYKLVCITLGCIILGCAHLSILKMKLQPYLNILLLGVASPLIACYWPCIPKIVSDNYLATAFAIIYCTLNLAYTLSPIIVANLVLKDSTYTLVETYIICIILITFCLVTLLSYYNWKNKLGLNERERMPDKVISC